jgi:hypothetical protein
MQKTKSVIWSLLKNEKSALTGEIRRGTEFDCERSKKWPSVGKRNKPEVDDVHTDVKPEVNICFCVIVVVWISNSLHCLPMNHRQFTLQVEDPIGDRYRN